MEDDTKKRQATNAATPGAAQPKAGGSPRSGSPKPAAASAAGTGDRSARNDAGPVGDRVKQDADAVKEKARRHAKAAGENLKAEARSRAEAGTRRAADEVDALSHAVDGAADELEKEHHEGLATYARELSEGMTSMAEGLRNKSVEDLLGAARSLARENPTAFLLGSVGLGFALSRIYRASSDEAGHAGDNVYETGSERGRPYPSAPPGVAGGAASYSGRTSPSATPQPGQTTGDKP